MAEPADPATPGERPYEIVPDRGRRGYDIRRVIDAVADAGSFCEQRPAFARSAVVGLARVQGTPVAMIANQPKFRGGVLDADAVAEITRIADLADGFGLPLVFLQDMPGVMIGLETSPPTTSSPGRTPRSASWPPTTPSTSSTTGGSSRPAHSAARRLAAELELQMHSAYAPWQAATQAVIHDVIRPEDTRRAVIDGLFLGSGYR